MNERHVGEELSTRALNRALLARQQLIERVNWPAMRMISHLAGLQAQAPNPPYFGLWSRLAAFRPGDLSALIESRQVVRISLMRSTIHLVTAEDCLAFRPLMTAAHARMFNSTYGRFLAGVELSEVAAAGRRLVEQQPRTFKELEALLAQQWPEHDPQSLAQTVRTFVPLVQVPPRGLWGQSGQSTHTSAEQWLGRPLHDPPDAAAMIRRYLAAFGPASVQDMQAWSGVTGLRPVVERLRPELAIFHDGQGRELFDLPDAPRPDPDLPIAPRFVAEFDNLLIAHADRRRIVSDERRKRVFTVNGIVKSTVLIDGFVAGTWKITSARSAADLAVDLFQPITSADRKLVELEGNALLAFAAADAATHHVRIEGPDPT